jgi:hypothetical protein
MDPRNEALFMPTITGIVTKGVVVPNSPLPEGARVEIQVQSSAPNATFPDLIHITPNDLRKMPREQRQVILAAAAELAEEDYREDKELTGFAAFAEEEPNDDESDAG